MLTARRAAPRRAAQVALEYRALASAAELEDWLDMVAQVFSPWGIRRAYFERHWTSDPHRPARRSFFAFFLVADRGPA